MKNETQTEWIKYQLKENGFITRNQCLEKYISRLGALILDLRKEGYEFTAEYHKTPNGKDYIYTLIKTPHQHQFENESTHNQKQLFKNIIISNG